MGQQYKHSFHRCPFILFVLVLTGSVPLGPITSTGTKPACHSHLLRSLLASPHRHPANQSKGRQSEGAIYQSDHQRALLSLIRGVCA